MAGRISPRDRLSLVAGAGYVWLAATGLWLIGELNGAPFLAFLALVSLGLVVATGLLVAWSLWSDGVFDVRLLAGAAAFAVVAGLLTLLGGRAFDGFALAAPGAVVVALLLYRDAQAWRSVQLSTDEATRRNLAETAAVAAAATTPAPKQPRLSPADRADRFVADVRTMTEPQLEALIEAWAGIDAHARESAWDAARPYLTASDRKDLLTQVREELKHWAAAGRSFERAAEIPAAVRRRAGRALLDAAVGVIAQDRVSKHNYDVLYAPFHSALTGDPVKIARARASRAGASKAGAAATTTPSPSPVADLPADAAADAVDRSTDIVSGTVEAPLPAPTARG